MVAGTGRRGPLFARLAAMVALAAIPVHLYWALGGIWGLPGGAATADLPGIHAANLAVWVLLACGVRRQAAHARALTVGSVRGPGRRPRYGSRRRACPGHGRHVS